MGGESEPQSAKAAKGRKAGTMRFKVLDEAKRGRRFKERGRLAHKNLDGEM
jgi:hypothetical protein